MMSQLENLESSLELFIENVRQLGIIVSDFQPQGQTILNQKMYVAVLYLFLLHLFSTVIQHMQRRPKIIFVPVPIIVLRTPRLRIRNGVAGRVMSPSDIFELISFTHQYIRLFYT